MSVTTEEAILHLREGIGGKQADILIDWMQGVEARLDAAGLGSSITALTERVTTAEGTVVTIVDDLHVLATKLDSDAGVTDEDYAATLTTPANPE